ncbi:unnamed protein product [Amaranthus hypochondriacus]
MKQILAPNAKISKGAKETIQECVSEFISFVTEEATDKENRKTLNGDDICWALITLGFDNYGEAITRYLQKYRKYELEKPTNCHGISTKEIIASGSEEKDQNKLMDQTYSTFPSLEFKIIDPKGKSPFKNPS